MGNLLTREFKRDFIHLSEHSDFKTALRATGDLLDTYAKAEKLRFERKQQRMREREQAMRRGEAMQHNRQREEADPRLMDIKDEGYGPTPRRQRRRNRRAERPPHCATLGEPRVSSALTCLQRDNAGRWSVQSRRNMTHMLRTNFGVEKAKMRTTTCNRTAGRITPTHINIQSLGCIPNQSSPGGQVPVSVIASEDGTQTCMMTAYSLEHPDLLAYSDVDQAGAIFEYLTALHGAVVLVLAEVMPVVVEEGECRLSLVQILGVGVQRIWMDWGKDKEKAELQTK